MYKIFKAKFEELPGDEKELIEKAILARQNGYSLHGSKVGAALKTKSGKIYAGCNVGNVTSTLNVHAEVSASCNAVCSGEREFEKIVVVPFIKNEKQDISQCGICLQFLSEFSDGDFKFIVADEEKEIIVYTFFKEIFPYPFGKKALKSTQKN